MPRKRSAEHCTVLPWLSGKADCKEGRFLQIGNSLFLSKAFQALSAGSQFLYLVMALESGGKRTFIFPLSSAKKYAIKPASFRRYVEELVKAGFIVKHSMANLRQPNEYEFSFSWKTVKPP